MRKLTAITGFLLLIWSSCLIAAEYEFTTIQMPESHSTMAYGINDMGDVVGSFTDCTFCQAQAFLFSDGEYYEIGVQDQGMSRLTPWGINKHGVIAGTLLKDGQFSAFVMGDTDTTVLDGAARADGLNNNPDTVVVGYRATAKFNQAAYLWRAGNYVALINPDLPGVIASEATSINDRGDIVGFWATDAGDGINVKIQGFIIKSGQLSYLDIIPLGINASGQIVGQSGAGYDGAILENGVTTVIKVPGADYTQVLGLNNRGHLVGYYTKAGVTYGFIGKVKRAAMVAKR
jgi:probable HAF family extracellular repeat protein